MDYANRKKFAEKFFGNKHHEIIKAFLLDETNTAVAMFWKPIEADDWIDDVYVLKDKIRTEYPDFPQILEVWISNNRVKISKVSNKLKVIEY